ncbi:hypothetical protein D3C81_1359430 [compost metagenome]
MVLQPQQEGRQQVLEAIAAVVDPRLGEGGAGGEGLERLDEARLQRVLDVGFDGPGPGLDHPFGRAAVAGLMQLEAQRRAEGEQVLLLDLEPDQGRRAVAVGQRHHRLVVPKSMPMVAGVADVMGRTCGERGRGS